MSWFNGNWTVSKNEWEVFFPKKVANNLYKDEFGKRALLIIDQKLLKEDSRYLTVQPFDNEGNNILFYFPVFGEDAPKVAKFLKNTCLKYKSSSIDKQIEELSNYLKEKRIVVGDSAFLWPTMFSDETYLILIAGKSDKKYTLFGTYVYVNALSKNLKELIKPDNTFTPIPLKERMWSCPVCGAETLSSLSFLPVCSECGWECGNAEDIDSKTPSNGNWTIKKYRINYFKNKMKNPRYRWWHGVGKDCDDGEFLLNTDIEDLFKKKD